MRNNESTHSDSSIRWRAQMDCRSQSLADHVAGYLLISPAEATDLIDFGSIHVNGRQERNPRRKLIGNEELWVYWPLKGTRRFYEVDPSRILFRDKHLLAYDKESGIPSQQTPSDAYNNLFAALARYLKNEGASDPYVALHHRLDKETSGVMVFALDRSVNAHLGRSFQQRRVEKDYVAWVSGCPPTERWVASQDITRVKGRYSVCPKGQGKSAETSFHVLSRTKDRSFILARPTTGRTHQIRLHLAASGLPVIGDPIYGGQPSDRLYLHAHRLKIPHPVSRSALVLLAPVPHHWPEPHHVNLPNDSDAS